MLTSTTLSSSSSSFILTQAAWPIKTQTDNTRKYRKIDRYIDIDRYTADDTCTVQV